MGSGKAKRERRALRNRHPGKPTWPDLPRWTKFKRDTDRDPTAPPYGPAAELWYNSRYIVRQSDAWIKLNGVDVPCIRLGICNVDQSARHDWREFQRIKNELIGRQAQGIEFYPPEAKLVDPSNYFLLWVFPVPLADCRLGARTVNLAGPLQRPITETS